MTSHAKLSPSSAHRWMQCAGSMILEKDFPDSSSEHADEGTAAHFLASECLEQNKDATDFLNQEIAVLPQGAAWARDVWKITNPTKFTVDLEMSEYIQIYLDAVRSQATGNELLVEQRVDFSSFIGAENAFGTSDVIILTDDEIQVHDLKYGRGVKVNAEDNEQLNLYALGALNNFEAFGDFKQVRQVIHQPRLNHYSEAVCSVEELSVFASHVRASANAIASIQEYEAKDVNVYLNPGEKQCQWCKAKATCPALAKHVVETVIGDFEDLDNVDLNAQIDVATGEVTSLENNRLGKLFAAVPLIENWIKALSGAVHNKLHAGESVQGFKIVQGKQGNRAWSNDDEAEALFKSMRLKTEEMYNLKVISPTTAEKLKKENVIGPRQWSKVESLITRADGKPTVVPESDKRPALNLNPQNDFENLDA
ncbi:DUF2800 domain-containing protein [Acinetobacter wuhouensis]|uniref:DUF2800 domain-containing protein n=1 Tax=Acinetobacter wuhouensis TaxID=1879050 RepID=A0A4Q7AJV6_9GAMM|nr:DUF2800 domain-containing protein [Acinetobacter wuhouensis]RZG47021.1 DUF2800 domain-containing protein [Acinetobacter wuhouensis]